MASHSTNYLSTFIRIAPDCKAKVAEEPPIKVPKSAVRLAYEMLIDKPYQYTSDDVLYETTGKPKGLSREQFFSKGQPCMRASMLRLWHTQRWGGQDRAGAGGHGGV